jgi:V8-like Glu-specific endopeptidase
VPILSGGQAERLSAALRDAFSFDEFSRLLYYAFRKRLDDITLGGSFETRVFDVILEAERGGWVQGLISAACDYRPGDVALRTLAVDVGLSAVDVPVLERIVSGSTFHDTGPWLARLGELERQVCRVEIPAGTPKGTGFLVAPDVALTAYHVIQELHEKGGSPHEARLRFDFKSPVVSPGTEFRLADDWLVAWRPPGLADFAADAGDQVPAPAADELDFVLLRVQGSPGKQSAGLTSGMQGAPARGWIRAAQVGVDGYAAKHTLLILQHPLGMPLKLAFGQSGGLNASGTRLRYQVSTDFGSSGSPCLNASLELIGLHQGGDTSRTPGYNSAVPIAAIRDYLAGSSVAGELFLD